MMVKLKELSHTKFLEHDLEKARNLKLYLWNMTLEKLEI
jgi:hypothetical protein